MNWKYVVAAVTWMGGMFIFSTDIGSYDNVGSVLRPLLLWLIPDLTPAQIDRLFVVIRTGAHLTEYFILSIFWGRALVPHQAMRKMAPQRASVVGAMALCGAWAVLDEYHQSFVASRTASIVDVGIDLLGASLGQIPGIAAAQWRRLSPRAIRRVQFFAWWFAWGAFSATMLLIVWQGGPFGADGMAAWVAAIGALSGMAGAFYGVRRR